MENKKTDVGLHQTAYLKAIEISDPVTSIKTYLEIVSKEDKQLHDALISINKSYDKCWAYINSKAKNYLKSKSGHIPPSTIYSWAIHYFIESDEFLSKETGANITVPVKKESKQNIQLTNETSAERMNRIKNQFKSIMPGE